MGTMLEEDSVFLDSEIKAWLNQNSFGPDIVQALEFMLVWSLKDLFEYGDVNLRESLCRFGVKRVPAKKVVLAMSEWKLIKAGLSTDPIANTLSKAKEAVISENQAYLKSTSIKDIEEEKSVNTFLKSASPATLRSQYRLESEHLEEINKYLGSSLEPAYRRMTDKAREVLKDSKSNHQTRMKLIKSTGKLTSVTATKLVIKSEVVSKSTTNVKFGNVRYLEHENGQYKLLSVSKITFMSESELVFKSRKKLRNGIAKLGNVSYSEEENGRGVEEPATKMQRKWNN